VAAQFQLLRLSLLPRPQPDLFSERRDPTREEYLRDVFGSPLIFKHYNSEFHYLPDAERTTDEAMIGRLGRQVTFDENLPPDQGLREISHAGWKACVIAVDPSDHEDGQKASIQLDQRVGTPVALFTTLVRAINETRPSAPYTIEASPIFDPETFWEFADENEGAVTSLTFEFTVPNGLWSAASSLKEELRQAKEKLGAQQVINTFKSDDGLETKAEQIKEAVEYAMEGSGVVKAKARKNRRFNSTEKPKTATLPDDSESSEHMIVRVARNLRKIFGRE
jgi:hypothetical protein